MLCGGKRKGRKEGGAFVSLLSELVIVSPLKTDRKSKHWPTHLTVASGLLMYKCVHI